MGSQYPETITAGGRTRRVSPHMDTGGHEDVTVSQVVYVLENWQLRGIKTDNQGRQSVVYLAIIPWREKMVRVVVSMNDALIITAFADSDATKSWNSRNIGYFARHYADLEIRDAS